MIKKIILDILDYLHYQVESDKCTIEELQSIYNSLIREVRIDATIKDVAENYGQSESNVRNVVARNYIGKPKRRVYYNMIEFLKHMPKNWMRNR